MSRHGRPVSDLEPEGCAGSRALAAAAHTEVAAPAQPALESAVVKALNQLQL